MLGRSTLKNVLKDSEGLDGLNPTSSLTKTRPMELIVYNKPVLSVTGNAG